MNICIMEEKTLVCPCCNAENYSPVSCVLQLVLSIVKGKTSRVTIDSHSEVLNIKILRESRYLSCREDGLPAHEVYRLRTGNCRVWMSRF
jgi:hypothetical protein